MANLLQQIFVREHCFKKAKSDNACGDVMLTKANDSSETSKKIKPAVWKFFEKETDKSVTCTVYITTLQYHGRISSIKEHLIGSIPAITLLIPTENISKANWMYSLKAFALNRMSWSNQ